MAPCLHCRPPRGCAWPCACSVCWGAQIWQVAGLAHLAAHLWFVRATRTTIGLTDTCSGCSACRAVIHSSVCQHFVSVMCRGMRRLQRPRASPLPPRGRRRTSLLTPAAARHTAPRPTRARCRSYVVKPRLESTARLDAGPSLGSLYANGQCVCPRMCRWRMRPPMLLNSGLS